MPAKEAFVDLSPYVYGTTRLGDDQLALADRIAMATAAMETGAWFHTSHQYGNALQVLRSAFDAQPDLMPKMIFKIGWDSVEEVRATVGQLTAAVGCPQMDIGQLCLNGALAEDFRRGGHCCGQLARMKEEEMVRAFVLQVFPWTSDVALAALRGGHAREVVDGYILYLNPLQRFASNELWALLQESEAPLIAMRTVAGGHVQELRDVPGTAWKPYLQRRAAQVAPLFESSGIGSWPEFCVRYAHSVPGVVATVGATSRPERLRDFVEAARSPITPLDPAIVEAIDALQRGWAAEEDVHGQPGSM